MTDIGTPGPQPTPVFDNSADLLRELDNALSAEYETDPIYTKVPDPTADSAGEVEGGEDADPPPSATSPPPSPPTIDLPEPTPPADPAEIPLEDLAAQAIVPPGGPPIATPDVGGAGSVSPTDPPPAPPSYSDPTAPVDANALLANLYGRPAQRGEVMEILGFVDRVSSLPLERQNMIAAILEGHDLTPPPAAPAAPTTPPPSPAPASSEPAVDAYGDPLPVDPRITQIEAQLAEQQAYWRQQQELAAQQQAQFARQQMGAGAEDFRSNPPIPLSDEELMALETLTSRSGILEVTLRNNANDPRAAWREALERTFWATPQYRDRANNAQQQQATTAASDARARQVAASAISPVTTAATATPNPPPTDARGRTAAAVAEMEQMIARAGQTANQ